MTNKELFKTLSKENQMEIVKTLASYDKVHVEFYNGHYHITPNWSILEKYPSDYEILNEFKKSEFDFDGHNYDLEWYKDGYKDREAFNKRWNEIFEKEVEKYERI